MFAEVVEQLVELPDDALVDHLRDLELQRRRLDAETAAALAIAEQRGLKDHDGHRSMAAFCRANFNWSTAEATRRMSVARAVDYVPGLGEQWYVGRFGSPQAQYLARTHGNTRIRDDVEKLAPLLLDHAEQLPYSDFTATVDHFVSLADEDGAHDDRDEQLEGRNATVVDVGGSLHVRASGGDGITTDEIIDIFNEFVDAEYQADVAARAAEHGENAELFPLDRTDRQRRFDALLAVFRHAKTALDTDLDPADVHTIVNVVVGEARWAHSLLEAGLTTDTDLDGNPIDPFTGLPVDEAKQLLDRILDDPDNSLLTRCETAAGTPVHPHDMLRAALAGRVRRVVIDSAGVTVDMGRKQRLFTGSARTAATLLIRHCEHPGCETPAVWCQVDHSTEWNEFGTTDQANSRVPCGYHNREKHRRRWRTERTSTGRTVTIRPDGSIIHPVGQRPPRLASRDGSDDDPDD